MSTAEPFSGPEFGVFKRKVVSNYILRGSAFTGRAISLPYSSGLSSFLREYSGHYSIIEHLSFLFLRSRHVGHAIKGRKEFCR